MSQDDETFGVVEKPKRASRKRVVTAVESEAIETPVPKKRAPRKKATSEQEADSEAVPTPRRTSPRKTESVTERKAPTPIAASQAAVKSTRRQVIVVAVLIFLGIGASAGVGLTDKGSIDVNKTIASRNDKITRGEEQGEIMPVQNTPQLPDGGLVGLGIGGPEASTTPAAATGTSTATSSEPVGQVPMTAAEAEAAAANAPHATST